MFTLITMQSARSLYAALRPCLVAAHGSVKVRYLRGERKLPRSIHFDDSEEDGIYQQLEQMEDALSNFDPSDPVAKKELQRMEIEERKFLKKKIIQKKLFKKPQEFNLLTWAAKEQIRFLNNEYPEEWTVDRLAESFPVSRDAVIKILKSKYVPWNESEILKHDKRVHNHWKALQAGKGSGNDGGPMDPALTYLLESKKTNLMLHAAGHKSLPMPSQLRTLVRQADVNSEIVKPGPFSRIVMNYERKVAEKSQSKSDGETRDMQQPELSLKDQDNRKLLGSVLQTINKHTVDADVVLQGVSKNRSEELTLASSPGNLNVKEIESRSALSRRERKILKQKETGINVNLLNVKTLQMLDTKKVVHSKVYDEEEEQYNLEEVKKKQVENSEFLTEQPSFVGRERYERYKKIDKLPFKYEERHSGKKDGKKFHQAYLYDDRHGYQYPLGVVDESLQDVKVPKGKKRKFYQRGDVVYDENGEFLYRIP